MPQSVGKQSVEAETGVTGPFRPIRPLPDRPGLGKGAMGTVYLAEDTQIERR